MPTATIGNVKGDTGATPQLSVNSVTTCRLVRQLM